MNQVKSSTPEMGGHQPSTPVAKEVIWQAKDSKLILPTPSFFEWLLRNNHCLILPSQGPFLPEPAH